MYWMACIKGGPEKVNHAAVAVGKHIYSFGGYSAENDANSEFAGPSRIDLFVLNTDSLRWNFVRYRGDKADDIPPQCFGHTVVAKDDIVYMFGGRNYENGLATVYSFDTANHKWSRVDDKGNPPIPRDGHTACVIGDHMYVFGGYEAETQMLTSAVHRLDLKTHFWEEVKTFGIPPPKIDFHTASVIGSNMYIFGGREVINFDDSVENYSNDIWCLDTVRMTWVCLWTSGNRPCGRRSHSAFVYEGKLYILYGFNSCQQRHFDDIYRFDPETNFWSEVSFHGTGPCPRRRQCCCLVGSRFFLFGGTGPSRHGEFFWLKEEVNGESLYEYSDLHVFDFLPTLQKLCIRKIIDLKLDIPWLPSNVQYEINNMTKNNKICRKFTLSVD